MLWHYPQKYTVVPVTRSLLFGSDVTYEQPHSPCLWSSPRTETLLSICHSAGNQQLQRLTFHQPSLPHLFPFSLWQETMSQSAVKLKSTAPHTKTIRYDMLTYLTLTRFYFSLLGGIRTSWDVTTFIHSTSAGGLQGPSAGADRWISQPKGSGKEIRARAAPLAILQHTTWLSNLP